MIIINFDAYLDDVEHGGATRAHCIIAVGEQHGPAAKQASVGLSIMINFIINCNAN